MICLTAQSGQMVMVPDQPVHLSVVHSTLVHNHNNVYGTCQSFISPVSNFWYVRASDPNGWD
jgi:hypothetical protein